MDNIKVSVIVPVYNAEKYLEKNLLLLSKQTLKEIEIILVNDASTDKSLDIMTAFKTVFPDKFVVIDSKKNRGPGGARSIGLKYARGEYIGFMDQDDNVRQMMYENLYNEAKKGNYDIVECNYFDRAIDGAYEMEREGGPLNYDLRKKILKIYFIWNKLFKKTLIDGMSMHFRENVIRDDTDFTFEAVMRAKRAIILPDIYYVYNNTNESTSRTANVDLKIEYAEIFDLIESMKSRIANLDNREEGLIFINEYILAALKRTLRFIVERGDFEYTAFLKWSDFAESLLPNYCQCKSQEQFSIEDVVFGSLTDNKNKSYKNLLRLRREIN